MPKKNLVNSTIALKLAAMISVAMVAGCFNKPPLPPAPERQIHYSIEQPGQVSLAVYDGDGVLLRELRRGVPHEAGTYTVEWDGLDRYGNPMPPGDYQWRLLRNQGLQGEYLLSFGSNPSSAPYHMWAGNHSGPASAHVDADGDLYVSAVGAENAPTLLKQSLDGAERLWDVLRGVTEGRWQGGTTLATDGGGRLYMLQPNGLIQVIDAETGQLLVDVVGSRAWAGGVRNRAKRKWDPFPDEKGTAGAVIAAGRDVVVVSAPERNTVRWLNRDDGATEHTVDIPSPRGVAVAPNGTVYVVSEGNISTVEPGGETRTVVDGLTRPRRLAYDEANDHLLVAVGEPRPNQVARYDLDGKLVETYGRAGGRRFGPYEPLDFYTIIDLAADRRGGFLVVESGTEAFRRTAHFDADGNLLNEWHGGQNWGSFVAFDPDDPTRVMFNGGRALKALAVADFNTRTYRVTHLLRAPHTGGLMPSLSYHVALWHLRRVDGELYMVNPGGHMAWSAPAVYRVDLEAGLTVPVARAGNVKRGHVWSFRKNIVKKNAPQFWLNGMKRLGIQVGRRMVQSRDWLGYSWSDDNGNGQVDDDEIRFGPSFQYSSLFIDDDWNLLLAGSPANPEAPFVYAVPNRNPEGIPPRWVWADAEPTGHRPPDEWAKLGRSFSKGVYRGDDGSLYVLAEGHAYPKDDKQGETWPASTIGAARLMKWNAEGELKWSVGRAATAYDSEPGEFHDPMRVLGEYRGNIVVQDRVIRPAQVFTDDGLYAGYFLDRHVDDGLPNAIYHTASAARKPGLFLHDHIGGVMHVTPDGEVLWNPSGRTGAPVYRIHGWDDWERQSGTVRIDALPPAATREGTGLSGFYYANRQWEGKPVLRRTDAELWFGNRTLSATRDLSGRDWKLDAAADGSSALVPGEFSARWEGEVEVPFSESFTFIIGREYYAGGARLWLDGEVVVGEQTMPQGREGRRRPHLEGRTTRKKSRPIPLEAGRRYAVRIDYASGGSAPQLHLIWESRSQERRHVPTELMYPAKELTDPSD